MGNKNSGGSAPPLRGDNSHPVKVVLVGDSKSGKTTFCMTLNGNSEKDYTPTVFDNFEYLAVEKSSSGEKKGSLKLNFWDTAGSEVYDELRPLSYGRADIFVIMISVVSPHQRRSAKAKWCPEIRRHGSTAPIILVGTQKDLIEDNESLEKLGNNDQSPVTLEEGKKEAREIRAENYYEINCLDENDCKELALNIARHYTTALYHREGAKK